MKPDREVVQIGHVQSIKACEHGYPFHTVRAAGMTASAFSQGFRKHTGMGVVEYVSRLRINLACQMLMNEAAMSVTDICFAVGFNNLSNFNRQFLRRKGMPPSRFRALLKDNRAVAA